MATSNNQPAGPKKPLDPFVLIVGALLLTGMVLLFWARAHTEIATLYAWIRVVQFALFVFLNSLWSASLALVVMSAGAFFFFKKTPHARYGLIAMIVGGLMLAGYLVGGIFASWFYFFRDSNKSRIEWEHLTGSSLASNLLTLTVFVIPFSVWMSRKSLATNPLNHKNFAKPKDYTLDSFTDMMAEHYPHLTLFRKLDLSMKSIHDGKYRMADTEKQIAIKYKLLIRTKEGEYAVDKERAAQYLRGTMGKLWRGYKGLTRWQYAVMAAIVPRIAATDTEMSEADYKVALETTENLLKGYWVDAAESYSEETDKLQINMGPAQEAMRKYGGHPKVQEFFKKHAYIGTVIYAMLLQARSLGVLEPAQFRWLRVADRNLWIIVDNVGRGVAFGECGAIYSHFLTEQRRKRAVERPSIDAAVKGLIEAVASFKFSEDELKIIHEQLAPGEGPDTIDVDGTKKEKLTYIAMALWNGEGESRELFDICIMTGAGDVVLNQRCKTPSPLSSALISKCNLTGAELEALKVAPTSAEIAAKVLELCNGHDLITFDKTELELVKGIDRSAVSIKSLRPDEGGDLASAAAMEEILIDNKTPDIVDAMSAAKVCRALWQIQRKAELQAQVQENKS